MRFTTTKKWSARKILYIITFGDDLTSPNGCINTATWLTFYTDFGEGSLILHKLVSTNTLLPINLFELRQKKTAFNGNVFLKFLLTSY